MLTSAPSSSVATPQNDKILRAARGEKQLIPPIWLMRQAGRYLPEYRATRAKAGSFLDLAKNPQFALEVTLQPIDRYALDAAILFSDILTIPDAMGLGLEFETGEGPRFRHPLQSEAAINNLRAPDLADLQYVFDAVKLIRTILANRIPLIGFSGSPFTLACYMIEGKGSSDFAQAKKLLFSRPDLFQHIVDINTQAVIDYLSAQIDAGAQLAMIFDSWGGMLDEISFCQYSLTPMQNIVRALQQRYPDIPLITFTKGGSAWFQHSTGAAVVGLDWGCELGISRLRMAQALGHKAPRALQGNLDPTILLAGESAIVQAVKHIKNSWQQAENMIDDPTLLPQGWIFNLGHGISQFTPPEAVATLVAAVRAV